MANADTATSVEIRAEVTGIEKVDALDKSVEDVGKQAAETAREEDRLAAIVEASKTRQRMAAQELLAAERKTYAEAESTMKRAVSLREAEARAVEEFSSRTKRALSDAFSAAGIRGSEAIQAEILNIQQSLLKLGANAKVSGADFDRAFSAAQTKIAALEAEMNGTLPAMNRMEGQAKGLRGEVTAMAGQFVGLFAAMQAGKDFIAANAGAESLLRTLTQLKGSSQAAAAELEYIRGASNRLGIDAREAAKSYTQLLAATQGTALEGDGARRVFEAVAGAMASLGKSSAETNSALLAVNQMASKGTVQMEELKGQLGEALPGALKAAANGTSLTVAELSKMVESGNVLAEDLLPALARGLTEMYGVGKAENETFVANLARLKNAVSETWQVIGDSGVFKAITQGLGLATQAVGVLTVGFEASAKKIGVIAGAIASGDFGLKGFSDQAKEALGEIDIQTEQSLQKISNSAKVAATGFDEAGKAVEEAGNKAAEASGDWLKIENAYSEVEKASTKQIANLKTLADANDAGAASMKAFADTFGTEAEKLDAATNAAKEHEAGLRKISDQVKADLEISKSRLAALEQERGSDGKLSESKEKLRDELQKTIAAKQAEADKTTQATAAAHSATLQAEAAQSVYADHSKQIYALRDAWQAAEAEYSRLSALNARGINVAQELRAADEERAKALLLYRDALADATAAAERHLTAERTASGLQQSALQNDLYRANTILEIAKQRGNEKDIAEAQIAVWRIELQISEAQAQAARLEADAMLLVANAKRAELEASGPLTESKKAELAVMDANIKAKEFEAQKYELVADRMKALSYETQELKSTFGDLSSAADEAATAADRVAGSYQSAASAIQSAANAKDAFAKGGSGDVISMAVPTPKAVTERLKGLGVTEDAATAAAPQFFDAYGNVQNTYGRTLDEAVQALADKLAGKIPQASTNTIVRTVRVEVVDGGNVLPMQVEEKYAQAVVNALRRAKGAMG